MAFPAISLTLLICLGWRSPEPPVNPAPPRNIIVILADDMGLASLHSEHPGSGLPTPNLDRLATEGLSLSDAHSGSAVCSPTRYGLLTGRYAWRSRLKRGIVGKWGPPLIEADRPTIADLAAGAGLHTACIGKWHLGWYWPTANGNSTRRPDEIDYTQPIGGGPLEAGFDHYFGDDVPNWPPYVWIEDDRALAIPTEVMEEDNANGVRRGPCTPGWQLDAVLPELTRRCVSYIRNRSQADEPFLLYFSMTSPHTPISPSQAFQGQSGVSRYADFLLETDWSIGQILRALDQYGLRDDTLVIVTGDNGTSPKCNFAELASGGVDLRGPWRGHKADIWEGGHRVPFLVRWPGVVEPGSRSSEPVALTDIYATLADALGATAGGGEDSRSLMPLLTQTLTDSQLTRAPLHESIIHHSSNGAFAIRSGRWKLCFCPGSGGWSEPRDAKARTLGWPEVQLFDMQEDPGESRNLAEQHPELVVQLTKRFRNVFDQSLVDSPRWWNQLPWPEPAQGS